MAWHPRRCLWTEGRGRNSQEKRQKCNILKNFFLTTTASTPEGNPTGPTECCWDNKQMKQQDANLDVACMAGVRFTSQAHLSRHRKWRCVPQPTHRMLLGDNKQMKQQGATTNSDLACFGMGMGMGKILRHKHIFDVTGSDDRRRPTP